MAWNSWSGQRHCGRASCPSAKRGRTRGAKSRSTHEGCVLSPAPGLASCHAFCRSGRADQLGLDDMAGEIRIGADTLAPHRRGRLLQGGSGMTAIIRIPFHDPGFLRSGSVLPRRPRGHSTGSDPSPACTGSPPPTERSMADSGSLRGSRTSWPSKPTPRRSPHSRASSTRCPASASLRWSARIPEFGHHADGSARSQPRPSSRRRIVRPRVVARFDRWVSDIVDEALDQAVAQVEFDWVVDVAKYIPSRVVARVLGVQDHRVQDIVNWTDAIFEAAVFPDARQSSTSHWAGSVRVCN